MLPFLFAIQSVLALKVNGRTYPVEQLTKADGYYTLQGQSETMFFNFNKTFDTSKLPCTEKAEENMVIDSFDFGEGDIFCLGLIDSNNPTITEFEKKNGIQITYSSSGVPFYFNITCGKEESHVLGAEDSTYYIVWTTPHGCPKGAKGGDTFGIIFVVVLLALIVLYFAVGIPVCAFGFKKRGLEMIPFISFWKGLFGLFLEGVKCMFPCCRSKSGYTNME
ncbi:hypothetical protein BLNAU_17745 [Blattamonas nauphoetae]|uniref:Uncharacterized protein n=1 Tax=Blattamonas nauphoetae TaxID=2049346 RepID=A0ABQ9X6Y5_9EUKA|nr:hypothetical protein BLNAU_17745 [Blattamonas nauphoetae]